VESQASTIRTLEAGGSSDPIPDAAGSVLLLLLMKEIP
jgi:hypothetical protein